MEWTLYKNALWCSWLWCLFQPPESKITARTYFFYFLSFRWRRKKPRNKKHSGKRERKLAIRTYIFAFQCLKNKSNGLNLNLPMYFFFKILRINIRRAIKLPIVIHDFSIIRRYRILLTTNHHYVRKYSNVEDTDIEPTSMRKAGDCGNYT